MVYSNWSKILIIYVKKKKNSRDLCVELGLAFCLAGLSQHKSQASHARSVALQALLSYLGLGTCEVVSPDLHVNRNIWDCMDWPQVTWNLGLGTMCELALRLWRRSALVKKFWGMNQYDWLRNGFFTGWDLHYSQEFLVEDFSYGWQKWHGWPTWQRFLLGEFSKGQLSWWATSNPRTRNLASREFQLEALYFVFFPSCPLYHPLPQKTFVLGWNYGPTNALLHYSLNWS